MSALIVMIALSMIPVHDKVIYRNTVSYENTHYGNFMSLVANYFELDNPNTDSVMNVSRSFKIYKDVFGIIKSPSKHVDMDMILHIGSRQFEISVCVLRSTPLKRDRYGKLVMDISREVKYSADMQGVIPEEIYRCMELNIDNDIKNIRELLRKEREF